MKKVVTMKLLIFHYIHGVYNMKTLNIQNAIVFLNNGSALIQTANYCHVYGDMNQLAEDVTKFISNERHSGVGEDGWDGNNPDSRMSEEEIDRESLVIDMASVESDINDDTVEFFGGNADEFARGFCKENGLIVNFSSCGEEPKEFKKWLKDKGYDSIDGLTASPDWLVTSLWEEYCQGN